MLSLPKLLLLILVIVAVWYGWRWYSRLVENQREAVRSRRTAARRTTPAGGQAAAGGTHHAAAEDMEKCPECGAYVAPRSAVSCGRPACPYGR